MMRISSWILVSVAAAAGWLSTAAAGEPAKNRVPANFQPITDASGVRWDLSARGTIEDGDSDCFDTGLMLQVNNRQFNTNQPPQMSKEGDEFFLTSRNFQPNINVERRIRIDRQRNYVQYFEIFTNTDSKENRVSCQIRTNFGNTPQMVVTEEGQPFTGGTLGKKGIGVLAVHNPNDQRPGVLFLLADSGSKLKPQVVAGGNNLMVTYDLTLKPNETVAVMYLVGQRRRAQAAGAPALFEELYKRKRLVKIPIPQELAKQLVNFPAGAKGSDDESDVELPEYSAFRPVLAQLEALGLERDKKDWLVFDGESNLGGEVSIPVYRVTTAYGPCEVSAGDIAMIQGGAGSRPVRTTLRSGEVLVGAVEAPGMKMTTDKGLVIDLIPAKLNTVVMRRTKDEGFSAPATAVIVRLLSGDAVAVREGQKIPLPCATPWGSLTVDLTELQKLTLERLPHPVTQLTLADHSQLPVILYGEPLRVQTLRFGEQSFAPLSIVGLNHGAFKTKAKQTESEEEAEYELDPFAPCFRLGETALAAGTFGVEELTITSEGRVTNIPAAQIRHLEPAEIEEGKPQRYTVKIIGGGAITGSLNLRVIPVNTPRGMLQIPLEHIREYCGKKPAAPKKEEPKSEPAAQANSVASAAAKEEPNAEAKPERKTESQTGGTQAPAAKPAAAANEKPAAAPAAAASPTAAPAAPAQTKPGANP